MTCFRFLVFLAFGTFMAIGQQRNDGLSFEVASVKVAKPGSPGPTMRMQPGGRFVAEAITLRNLIVLAYHVADNEVFGLPSWCESTAYDIDAKPSGNTASPSSKDGRDQQMLRLQSLLASRFGLKVHKETVQRNVLALVVAKNGLKVYKADEGGRSCKATPDGPGTIVSMEMFARDLANITGQKVFDRTGMQGYYCIRLRWTSDDGIPRALGATIEGVPVGARGPSIYSALTSQLGLRLQSEKGPVAMLLVDKVSPLRPN